MKVLMLSHGHPAFSIGGAEVASYNLHNGLNALDGAECHYLARVGPPIARHAGTPFMSLRQAERETLFHAGDYDWFRLSNRDLDSLTRDLARFVADVQPDVVHFHHVLGFGVEAIRAVRRALPRAPIVLTLHEFLPICHNHGQMVKTKGATLCSRASPAECGVCFPEIPPAAFLRRELFLKSFFAEVDAFVSPSKFLLERYAAWGLPRERLHMLENGLDGGAPAPPRPAARDGRRNRFAFFGQLNPFKGVKTLVEAVGRMPAETWRDDSALYVFGGNLEVQPEAFQQDFKRLVTAAGRRVRFFGSYKAADLPRLMREVDWVVVPSTWWENSPVVIQEAFFHGRPVIASDIGGMAEKVRHAVDGLHFRVGSAESLVDRLIEAIETPGLWGRLRSRIKKPVTAPEAARRHRELYARLIRQRAAAAPAADAGAAAD